MHNIYLQLEIAARLEGISYSTMRQRLHRKSYPEWAFRKTSRLVGGYQLEINISALSQNAQAVYLEQNPASNVETGHAPSLQEDRKTRSDSGSTKVDEQLLLRSAAIITMAKSSSPKRLKKNFGYKDVYDWFVEVAKAEGKPICSYRHFITLCEPWVDKEAQTLNNLGPVRYKNSERMFLTHDYSVYEPMQYIQSDHTQFDVVCLHNGKVLRPWAAFHNSLGDRMLSYPTVTERPDSYSLADNFVNFVFKYGLSDSPVIYKTDNGKAMKSKLMTKNGVIEEEYKGYNIEERHLQAMKMMGLGVTSDKGVFQNLGVIEKHSMPREPWTKLIERQFGIGGTMEWFAERKEYTGRIYLEKPEQFEKVVKSGNIWSSEEMIDFVINKVDKYNNREHQSVKKEAAGKFAVPHLYKLDLDYFQSSAQFLELTLGHIPDSMEDVYRILNDASFSKDQLKTNLYSPMWRRRIFELCGWQSRAIASKEELAMLVMKSEVRSVHRYGININNLLYMNYQLRDYIGKKIIIRYSPSNILRIREQSGKEKLFIKEVYVFIKEKERGQEVEKFICIAEPHPATVSGMMPDARTKAFLSIRSEAYKENSLSLKIATGYSTGKEETKEKEFSAPVIQLNTRGEAAQKMAEAKIEKQQKVITQEKVNAELEDKLSAIYGTQIQIGE